jgi:hypothetical protein
MGKKNHYTEEVSIMGSCSHEARGMSHSQTLISILNRNEAYE